MSTILLAFKDHEMTPEYLSRIGAIAPDRDLIVTQDRTKIEAMLDDIEISVCSFPRDLLSKAPNLRWHQEWGAGVDWLLRYPELADSNLIVTNASGVHAVPISEHIMAFLLSFARDFPGQMRNQAQSLWKGPTRANPLIELEDATMLLIGVGAIGERTAKLADAHGIKVIGVRRNPTIRVDHVAGMIGPDALLDYLPQADFVVLTVPMTAETEKMIGEQELRAMKESAFIVNIGRGGTIDEPKLIQALQEGWIRGAGLDVVAEEPLVEGSPLWGLENVIITAHYSGRTPRYTERALEIFLDNLTRYVEGKPMRNLVDKRLGY